MWEELKQRVNEKNANNSPFRIEWYSDGEKGKGTLTDMLVSDDYIEFLITDDKSEIGSFTLRSSRNFIGISTVENGLYISSYYMGSITILNDE